MIKSFVCVLAIIFLIVNNINCNDQDLKIEKLLFSKNENFSDGTTEVSNVTVIVNDNTLVLKSGKIGVLKTYLLNFSQKKDKQDSIEIHYAFFEKCTPDTEISLESKPIKISLKNPITLERVFLRLEFSNDQNDNILPRDTITNSIGNKCDPVKSAVKTALLSIEKSLSSTSKAAKSRKDSDKNKPTSNSSEQKTNPAELKELNNQLDEKTKDLKIQQEKLDQKKSDAKKVQASVLEETSKKDKSKNDQQSLQSEILKKQNEQKKSEDDLEKSKANKEKVQSSVNDKSNEEAIAASKEKIAQYNKIQSDINELSNQISKKSQEYLDTKKKQDEVNNTVDTESAKLDTLNLSSKSKEVQNLVENTEDKKNKCRDTEQKYNEAKKNSEENLAGVQTLSKQLLELMENKDLLKESHTINKKNMNKEAKGILDQLDSSFIFKPEFISATIIAFARDNTDSINLIKSIKPNESDNNTVDNIFTSKNNNVCSLYKTQMRKQRKEFKKVLKEKKFKRKEEKKNKKGKTGLNGLVYNGSETKPNLLNFDENAARKALKFNK